MGSIPPIGFFQGCQIQILEIRRKQQRISYYSFGEAKLLHAQTLVAFF